MTGTYKYRWDENREKTYKDYLNKDGKSKLKKVHPKEDGLDKFSQQSLSEPFKGTELEGTANAIDKATGWLDKKMAGWAGKKPEGDKK